MRKKLPRKKKSKRIFEKLIFRATIDSPPKKVHCDCRQNVIPFEKDEGKKKKNTKNTGF
jgi:hypothetical protein